MAGLDLHEIQGNILRGYPHHPEARFMYFRVRDAAAGRRFLQSILDDPGVTPARWEEEKPYNTNIGLSHRGLIALGIPDESADSFPVEFCEGMRSRRLVIGDWGESGPEYWDEPWASGGVHIVVMCYAKTRDVLAEHCEMLLARAGDGVDHLGADQDAAQIKVGGNFVEHFGFVDGLSNPAVEGAPGSDAPNLIGNPTPDRRFEAVPPGEFVFGYPGVAGEERPAPLPRLLSRNGTFMVFRKLEQDVGAFRAFVKSHADTFARVAGPGADEELLAAKLVGRWPDGTSLVVSPTKPRETDFTNDFDYLDDPDGAACPLGAHVRRSNPRGGLGLGGELTKRRRLIRRGIPYGSYTPPGETPDDAPRGLMFLAFMSGIERQFEFLQQEWINGGDDFDQGNDKDPIVGDHDGKGQMVIQGDERLGRAPYLCTGLRRFVRVRGGDYFFVPGLTGLRLIAEGQVRVQ